MNEIKRPTEGYTKDDWQHHYETDDLRWDLEGVSPPFARLWENNELLPGKAIIPGCGRGHEVLYLAERGFEVTAVDFAEGAVALLTQNLRDRGLEAEVLFQDFFELSSDYDQRFDLMLEQTFFCAITPSLRLRYVDTAARLLKSGGLLVGLFYETNEEGGPPFNTTYEDVQSHFSRRFTVERLEKAAHSIERRKDKEWLAFLRKT